MRYDARLLQGDNMPPATKGIQPLTMVAAISTACGLVVASLACSALLTVDEFQGGATDAGADRADATSESDAPDASDGDQEVDVASDVPMQTCDPCQDTSLVRLPCRPAVDDLPSGEDLVFAARTMRLGFSLTAPEDWQNLGLDRDCLHTEATGKPTGCVLSVPQNGRDGLQGRDNSFGLNVGQLMRLLNSLGITASDLEEAVNGDIGRGDDGWTVGLQDFNHTRNDPQVTVVIRLSEGTTTDSGEKVAAKWDSTDRWSIDPASHTAYGEPVYLDDNAYVVDGELVAKMPKGLPFDVQVDQGKLSVYVTEVVMRSRLSDDFTRIEQGVVSAVWPQAVAMDQTLEFAMRFGLCPPNPILETIKTTVKQAADIRIDLLPAPALPCNAISFGMMFTADKALLGPVAPAQAEQPPACADAGQDGG
jgi:hypothetical protein